jgi:hypothetical protein
MNISAIIFSKIKISENSSKVLFCIADCELPQFNLAKISPTHFAQENLFSRHDKFDWHVNKAKPICYFFEVENCEEAKLPNNLKLLQGLDCIEWLTFPHAVKKLKHGTHRNLLQLAVQYISYGMVDDSVIAADYNEEWIHEQLKKSEEKKE